MAPAHGARPWRSAAPELGAAPGEVFERIAQVHHLPVEDSDEPRVAAVAFDEEVSEAVIAVDQGPLVAGREICAQPDQRVFEERRPRNRGAFDALLPAGELALGSAASRTRRAQELEALGLPIDGVEPRK
jgi:hypothetical protein